MHVENELEFVTTGEQEYEEVVEEYEEEIPVQEGVPELTDVADITPAPRQAPINNS
jgi:AAA+ superfamily predicted ATPase